MSTTVTQTRPSDNLPPSPAGGRRIRGTGRALLTAAALIAAGTAITVPLIGGTIVIAGTPTVNATATYTTGGSLTLYAASAQDRTLRVGSACEGQNGFEDITQGAPVTLFDQGGTIVAAGALGQGSVTAEGCAFIFTIPGVPYTANFFQYEITHRGKLTASKQDALDGNLAASLGTP